MTGTKFLIRIRKGVYRVHPDVLDAFIIEMLNSDGS